jgi:hypothetical protein
MHPAGKVSRFGEASSEVGRHVSCGELTLPDYRKPNSITGIRVVMQRVLARRHSASAWTSVRVCQLRGTG